MVEDMELLRQAQPAGVRQRVEGLALSIMLRVQGIPSSFNFKI